MDWTAIGVAVSIIVMLGSLMLYLHSSVMDEIKELRKGIQNIDTVLIVKDIMPSSLVKKDKE